MPETGNPPFIRILRKSHIRRMHRIFKRHWPAARTAEGYRTSPRAKKLLWHIYACAPVTATALVYLRARRQEHGPQLR